MRSFIISEIIYWGIAIISIISVIQHWNFNRQKAYIFIVFGITGSLALWVAKPVLSLLGANSKNMSLWIYVPIRIAIIFPIYQILILIIGTLFGQFRFFWKFEKKMLSHLGFKKFKEER